MKTALLCAGALALLLLLPGCGPAASHSNTAAVILPPPPGYTPNLDQGRRLFAQSCAACHGAAGKGIPYLGKDFTQSSFVKERGDAELVAFLKQGRPASDPANTTRVDMPPKGGNPALTDEQLFHLVSHLRTLR